MCRYYFIENTYTFICGSDERSGRYNIFFFFFVNLRTFQYKVYHYSDIYYHSYEYYLIRARTDIFLRDTKDYQSWVMPRICTFIWYWYDKRGLALHSWYSEF